MFKCGTKNALFGYFLNRTFAIKKLWSYLKSVRFKFVNLQNFTKKQCLNVGPKTILGAFLGWHFKKKLWYLKPFPQICLTAKFCKERKMLKFCSKNAFFLYLDFLGLEFQKNYCDIWYDMIWYDISLLEFF